MTAKICSIPDCRRVVNSRGWCSAHYMRWRTHGDPLGGRTHYGTPEESLKARTRREGECLIWTGSTTFDGYGNFHADGRTVRVHRYVWERVNGPIPEGMEIDHTCWNRACCEVGHLRVVSRAQNMSSRSGARKGKRANLPRNVYRHSGGKYQASVCASGATHHLGTYATAQEASLAAEAKRQELFGEFAGRG